MRWRLLSYNHKRYLSLSLSLTISLPYFISLSHSLPPYLPLSLSLSLCLAVSQTIIHSTQKERGKSWLKECDLVGNGTRSASSASIALTSSSLTHSSREENSSSSISTSISERYIRSATSSHSRNLVTTASRTDHSGGVKVSPVHWGDIGGLDRYAMIDYCTASPPIYYNSTPIPYI